MSAHRKAPPRGKDPARDLVCEPMNDPGDLWLTGEDGKSRPYRVNAEAGFPDAIRAAIRFAVARDRAERKGGK